MATTGNHIDWSSGTQSTLFSKSYSSGDKALANSGSGKYYYMPISALRWRIDLRTDYNFFGTPVFYAIAQKWVDGAWSNYGSEQRVDGSESRPTFRDDGSNCHIWRLRYRSVSGQFLEYLYGSFYIYGYSYGTETTYNDSLIGEYIRRTKGGMVIGKNTTDFKPTDTAYYDMYETTSYRGSLVLASIGEDKLVSMEF